MWILSHSTWYKFRRSGQRPYDFENHLTLYGAVVIKNDGDGNRVSETIGGVTTKYLVDTLNPTGYAQVMDEVVGTAVSRTYAYGLNRISENQLVGSTWTPSFYGYDGHGNVRFLTSAAGAVTDTYKYDAFGVLIGGTGSTANNFLYSGEQYDSTLGLYYLRARYYNPAVGRFQTADPYEGRIRDPLTLNKYLYVGGNPTRFVDPAGLDPAGEYAFDLQNLTLNEARAARRLRVAVKPFRCAIHALKAEYGLGGDSILIDVTNGNAFLPGSLDFLGCILDYPPLVD